MVQKDGRGRIKTSWMGDSAASNQQKSDASVDASERTEGTSSVFFSPLGSPQKLPYSVTPSRVEEEEQRREGERIIPRGGRDHDREGERESRKGGLRFAYAYL